MVLRTNFKAFKEVVSSEKKIFQKFWNFLTFFAYPGSQISWKMTNFFFERYGPEIFHGLHKLCCEIILRCFRLFRAKNFFFLKIREFLWLFLHIRGHRFLEKWPTSFLRDTGLKFFVDCTNGVANEILRSFRLFRAKKNFFQNSRFFDFFCITGGHRFLEKWPTSFLRDTGLKFVVDCTNGVANKF